MRRERREPEAGAAGVDRDRIVDRPRLELAVVAEHELRAVQLVAPVVHPHPVGEVGEVYRVGVAARDRDLEHVEAAALQPDVLDRRLRHQPRRLRAVVPHQRPTRPLLVVVEHRPEPLRPHLATLGIMVRRQGEQLDAEPGIARLRGSRWRRRTHHLRG